MTGLELQRYSDQVGRWPGSGRHILAHFDRESIVVYQAYRREIADHAVAHRALGGDAFSYGRMSWIKPNFLWMMYRSGWGTKPGQDGILGLRISRAFFDELLARAVWSSYDPTRHASREQWEASVSVSDVRLQWDPDHDPNGSNLERRALQLGLRGPALEQFGKRELLEVHDLSPLVAAQRTLLRHGHAQISMPLERVYRPADEAIAKRIGLADSPVE